MAVRSLRASLSSEKAVVLALALIALALRVSLLHPDTLWRDDAWVALSARVPLSKAVQFGATTPGFMAFVHWWEGVVGLGRALRAPGAVLGALAAPLVYLAARWSGLRKLSAVAAGLIVACSSIAVNQSDRLKEFSFDQLAAAACLLVGLWLARSGSAGRAYLAAIALIAMTAVSAAVVPVAIGAYALAVVGHAGRQVRWQRPSTPVMMSAASYGCFLLVWYGLVLSHIPAALGRYWLASMPARRLSGVGRLARNVGGVFHGMIPLPEALSVTLVLIAAALLATDAARRPLTAALLVPLALAIVADIAHRAPLGDGRTDTFLYPSLALLLALALNRALAVFPRQPAQVVAYGLLLAMPIHAVISLRGYPAPTIVSLAEQVHLQPGDRLILSGGARYPYVLYRDPGVTITIDHGVQSNFALHLPPGAVQLIDREPPDDKYVPDQAAREAQGASRVWFLGTVPNSRDSAIVNNGGPGSSWDELQERSLAAAGWRLRSRVWLKGAFLSLWVRA